MKPVHSSAVTSAKLCPVGASSTSHAGSVRSRSAVAVNGDWSRQPAAATYRRPGDLYEAAGQPGALHQRGKRVRGRALVEERQRVDRVAEAAGAVRVPGTLL